LRLDLFLKVSRLIKQRALAKKACEAGLVEVGGSKAKPSTRITEGQVISIHSPTRLLEVRVLKIPEGNVSKTEAFSLYSVIRNERGNCHGENG
jgi:ribosomal 50S subunit-recycling heat shock protein